MKVVKEKNYLLFYLASEKPYKIDINTGVVYGTKDVPIKSVPVYMRDVVFENRNMSNVMRYVERVFDCCPLSNVFRILRENKDILSMLDRLDALNINYMRIQDFENTTYFDFLSEHFSEYVEQMRGNNHPINLRQFYEDMGYALYLKEAGVSLSPATNRSIYNFIRDSFFYANDIRKNQFTKYGKMLCYYLVNGGLFYLHCNDSWNADDHLSYVLYEFCNCCDILNIQPEKGNFLKLFQQYKETARIEKEKVDVEKLKAFYERAISKLFYENDEYTVVIPTSPADFKSEAEQQENCVYRSYLPCVLQEQTYVVFIRKKSDVNKSFITCEVSLAGQIRQFYYKYNEDATENSFYLEYCKHLKEKFS